MEKEGKGCHSVSQRYKSQWQTGKTPELSSADLRPCNVPASLSHDFYSGVIVTYSWCVGLFVFFMYTAQIIWQDYLWYTCVIHDCISSVSYAVRLWENRKNTLVLKTFNFIYLLSTFLTYIRFQNIYISWLPHIIICSSPRTVYCVLFLKWEEIESCVVKKRKQIIGLRGCDTWSELCSEISVCCFKMYTASGAVGSQPSLIFLTFPTRSFTFIILRLTNSQPPKYVKTEVNYKTYYT